MFVAPVVVGVTAFNGEVHDNSVLSKTPSLSSSMSTTSFILSLSVSAHEAYPRIAA